MKVCLVTPDIVGPVRNGGIGTHCYRLALLLARERHDVTVLFTSPFEKGDVNSHRAEFAKLGIEFHHVDEAPGARFAPDVIEDWFLQKTHQVHRFLTSRSYDLIHFQDWQANGFMPIQSKRMGVAFQNTRLVLTLHSSSEWVRDGMQSWSLDPLRDAKLDFMERYTAEHADLVVSPSQNMLDWVKERGWRLAKEHRVLAYPPLTEMPKLKDRAPVDLSHLAFFGRLETRKGLEVFCEAVELLIERESPSLPRKITFLGKPGTAIGATALDYLYHRFQFWPKALAESTSIISDLDAVSAMDFLSASRAVAVMPSLLDNLPLSLLEVIEAGLPFLSSNAGGMPEAADASRLFTPTPFHLARALEERGTRLAVPANHAYRPSVAKAKWLSLHEEKPRAVSTAEPPLVSVCIPHFNHATYLPAMLESIARNKHEPMEVVVVDDGSTCELSKTVFRQMKQLYQRPNWRFIEKENEGPSVTRNYLAHAAKGEYLIFFDSDNTFAPNAVATLAKALAQSGADCVTCHMLLFKGELTPEEGAPYRTYYFPIGPCVDAGMSQNVFGDTSFCIRKSAFLESGGFTSDRSASFEDWEYLARISLAGRALDVVPVPLVYYRETPMSSSRSLSIFVNRRRALRAYDEAMPETLRRTFSQYIAAYHFREETLSSHTHLWPTDMAFSLNTRSFRIYRSLVGFVLQRRWIRPLARTALSVCDSILKALAGSFWRSSVSRETNWMLFP